MWIGPTTRRSQSRQLCCWIFLTAKTRGRYRPLALRRSWTKRLLVCHNATDSIMPRVCDILPCACHIMPRPILHAMCLSHHYIYLQHHLPVQPFFHVYESLICHACTYRACSAVCIQATLRKRQVCYGGTRQATNTAGLAPVLSYCLLWRFLAELVDELICCYCWHRFRFKFNFAELEEVQTPEHHQHHHQEHHQDTNQCFRVASVSLHTVYV